MPTAEKKKSEARQQGENHAQRLSPASFFHHLFGHSGERKASYKKEKKKSQRTRAGSYATLCANRAEKSIIDFGFHIRAFKDWWLSCMKSPSLISPFGCKKH